MRGHNIVRYRILVVGNQTKIRRGALFTRPLSSEEEDGEYGDKEGLWGGPGVLRESHKQANQG